MKQILSVATALVLLVGTIALIQTQAVFADNRQKTFKCEGECSVAFNIRGGDNTFIIKSDKGPKGDQGDASTIPGPKGDTGDTGAAGQNGRNGTDSTVPGPAGRDGTNGTDGTDGTQLPAQDLNDIGQILGAYRNHTLGIIDINATGNFTEVPPVGNDTGPVIPPVTNDTGNGNGNDTGPVIPPGPIINDTTTDGNITEPTDGNITIPVENGTVGNETGFVPDFLAGLVNFLSPNN